MIVDKLLVKMDADYADEFSVYGFSIMSQEDYDKMMELAAKAIKHRGEIEVGFGTNEGLLWDSVEGLKRSFTIRKITDQEAMTLENMFGTDSFGTCTPGRVLKCLQDSEDDEDDDE
jgi:hypothetical protein